MNPAPAAPYSIVFDFLDSGFPMLPTVFGVMGIIACIGIFFERHKMMPNRSPETRIKIAAFVFTIAVGWTLVTGNILYSQYHDITRAIADDTVQVAEGKADHFVALIENGSPWEKFCVGDACFHYSDFVPTAGFHNTAKYGGPVYSGAELRVLYTGNLIVRLEIRKGT